MRLASSTGSLTVIPDAQGVGGWSQVYLDLAGNRRTLGAERFEYIAVHFSSFLADPSPERRWVLSLAERHTSIYGEHVHGETILHLQDADGKMFATLVLTTAEKELWLAALLASKRAIERER